MKLKLGTRKSLLAWAQSGWVAREIERLNPHVTVELVGIETRGDKIQDVPLQAVEGKEFFVAEIDQALRERRVDLTVHSLKDLSLERPKEFVCGAIPKREDPRDVLLFGVEGFKRAMSGEPIKIGTSSPRRRENLAPLLKKILPKSPKGRSKVELIDIRGNVNTRLSRVHEKFGAERYLDAVVLAFAGLNRLHQDSHAGVELSKLLVGVRWMVMPLSECPTNPGQGALAIECRADDFAVSEALSLLHHTPTAKQVGRERELLGLWGGGCHQKFGATVIDHAEAGEIFWIKGEKPNGERIFETRWKELTSLAGSPRPFNGLSVRSKQSLWTEMGEDSPPDFKDRTVFIAHSRAVPPGWARALQSARVWTSGLPSWERLSDQGLWVEGCAEGMGYRWISSSIEKPVLGLNSSGLKMVLTHQDATRSSEWDGFEKIATYRVDAAAELNSEQTQQLKEATHVFWASGSQWSALNKICSKSAHHSCGPGKTAAFLRDHGVTVEVFPTVEEWRKWLRISNLT